VAICCDIFKTRVPQCKVDSSANRLFWGKESVGKGAKTAQTLYMTVMIEIVNWRPAQDQGALGLKATVV
jgi:hypothetical protein